MRLELKGEFGSDGSESLSEAMNIISEAARAAKGRTLRSDAANRVYIQLPEIGTIAVTATVRDAYDIARDYFLETEGSIPDFLR